MANTDNAEHTSTPQTPHGLKADPEQAGAQIHGDKLDDAIKLADTTPLDDRETPLVPSSVLIAR
ncbi:hypothetical protein POX_c04786 [Penicillium oxalicum]|uniref:hypothetical protein n=1 Tax=Penicillium oxalicum TaxID=69781 RepID=UPI0020B7EF5F|nr:hypothetical protein POX_c04786 [Penicillium oxalicum]KAI2791906.1 hypothetical protein POX_c04786 [Penicillium oxalicum]